MRHLSCDDTLVWPMSPLTIRAVVEVWNVRPLNLLFANIGLN